MDRENAASWEVVSLGDAAVTRAQAEQLTARVLRAKQASARRFYRWRTTGRTNGPFPALAEAGMLCAGRSSDFRVRSVRPSRLRAGDEADTDCDNGQETGWTFFADKTLGYSGGAVPESHRVPCTSTVPQERPTTSAQFKLPGFYHRLRRLSNRFANQDPLQAPPIHGHDFQRQSFPSGAVARCGDSP